MFFDEKNITVNIVNLSCIDKHNIQQTQQNILKRNLHKMILKVSEGKAEIIVDDFTDFTSAFSLAPVENGSISIASNGCIRDFGSIKSFHLKADSYELFIDFSENGVMKKIAELFDCYYFDNLDSSPAGIPANISSCWTITDRGTLAAKLAPSDFAQDYSNFTLLTLKNKSFKSFTVTLEYEQSWIRYGIVFGCEAGFFPYIMGEYGLCRSLAGSFAYIEAEGTVTMRGGLCESGKLKVNNIQRNSAAAFSSYKNYFNRFICSDELPSQKSHLHQLRFIIQTDAVISFDGHTSRLSDNSLIYIPANKEYSYSLTFEKNISISFELFNCFPNTICQFKPENPDTYQQLMEKMYSIWTQKLSGYKYECTSMFYKLMSGIQSECSSSSNAKISPRIQTAYNYINEYYNDPNITISLCAEMCGISEVHFRQIFYKCLGVSPKKYILSIRIYHAISLLNTQNYKISEIAEKTGFVNAKYFSVVFKNIVGLTPSEYKNSIS